MLSRIWLPILSTCKAVVSESSDCGYITFSDRFQLSGALHDERLKKFILSLIRIVAQRLPYWSLSSPADVITFSNESDFIKFNIPASIRKAVKERKPRHYSQRITLLADGLDVWVLCADIPIVSGAGLQAALVALLNLARG